MPITVKHERVPLLINIQNEMNRLEEQLSSIVASFPWRPMKVRQPPKKMWLFILRYGRVHVAQRDYCQILECDVWFDQHRVLIEDGVEAWTFIPEESKP